MNDSEIKKEFSKWLIAYVNHSSLFTVTFLFVYIVYNVAILMTAKFTNLSVSLSNYTIIQNSASGNISNILITFMSGPIAVLFITIASYSLFSKYKKKRGLLKLLFLWLYINSINLIFGSFVIGTLTESGIGEVVWRLHVSDILKIMLIFISLLFLVLIGNSNSKYFFTTSTSRTFIETRQKRLLYLTFCILASVITGIAIFSLLNLSTDSLYQRTIFLFLILILLPSFRDKKSLTQVRVIKELTPPGIVWGWVFLIVILAAIYKVFDIYFLSTF